MSPPQEPPHAGAAASAHLTHNFSLVQRGWVQVSCPQTQFAWGTSQDQAFPLLTSCFLPAQIHLGLLMGSVFFFGQRVVPAKQTFFLIPPLSDCFRRDLISPHPRAGLGSLLA